MKKIIVISAALLSLCLILLTWLQKYPEEKLSKKLFRSQNFIAYNKLINDGLKMMTSNLHHRRDSIKKERTKHVFDYSFQKKDNLPLDIVPNRKELLKKNFHESFNYFKKIYQEFPELKKISTKSRVTIFKKAREILNGR